MQGQLALTGQEWCDFGGISVERIYFDADHWENVKTGVLLYKVYAARVV